jgi:hypothetical protein
LDDGAGLVGNYTGDGGHILSLQHGGNGKNYGQDNDSRYTASSHHTSPPVGREKIKNGTA